MSFFNGTRYARVMAFTFTLLGIVFIWQGYGLRSDTAHVVEDGIPVALRVIDMLEREGTFAPVFEVASGPYAGKKSTSSIATYPPLHHEGDEVNGVYLPASGEILSERAIAARASMGRDARRIGFFALFVGLAVLAYLYRARLRAVLPSRSDP